MMNKNGSEAAIDAVWRALRLPADNSTSAIVATILAHTIFLYFGALISPFEVIMLRAYVAESADVTKKIASRQMIKIEITLLNG